MEPRQKARTLTMGGGTCRGNLGRNGWFWTKREFGFMEDYQEDVRIKVTAACGVIVNTSVTNVRTLLDEAIISLAGRTLTDSQLTAFYYLYRCEESWQKLENIYRTKLHKPIKIASLKRLGADAVRTLRAKARNSKELGHWLKEYRNGERERSTAVARSNDDRKSARRRS